MNDYAHVIKTLVNGAGLGILGFSMGIFVLFDKMTLTSSIRYAIVSLVSGAVSFQMAESTMSGNAVVIAILSGMFAFFVIKIVLYFLHGASSEPDKALDKIIELLKSFKK